MVQLREDFCAEMQQVARDVSAEDIGIVELSLEQADQEVISVVWETEDGEDLAVLQLLVLVAVHYMVGKEEVGEIPGLVEVESWSVC